MWAWGKEGGKSPTSSCNSIKFSSTSKLTEEDYVGNLLAIFQKTKFMNNNSNRLMAFFCDN